MGNYFEETGGSYEEVAQNKEQSHRDEPMITREAPVNEMLVAVTDMAQRVSALENELTALRESAHSHTSTSNSELLVAGYAIRTATLPKQDAFIAGMNKVGRPGVVVLLNDGVRDFTIAKIEWDHNKESFVFYTGTGVSR